METQRTHPTSFTTPRGLSGTYAGASAVGNNGAAGVGGVVVHTPRGATIAAGGAAIGAPGRGSAGIVGAGVDLNSDGTIDRGGAVAWKYDPASGGKVVVDTVNGEPKVYNLPPRPVRPA